MLHVLEAEETSKSLQITDVNVSLKRLEAIETDVKARVCCQLLYVSRPCHGLITHGMMYLFAA